MKLEHFILLITKEKLDSSETRLFYRCITSNIDNDILSDHKGYKIIYYTYHDSFCYLVPLTADPKEYQVSVVVGDFIEYTEKDFYLETSTNEDEKFAQELEQDVDTIINAGEELEAQEQNAEEFFKSNEMSEEISKFLHKQWMNQKIQSGWAFGPDIDLTNKLHPLLLPWEQLPAEYKNPNSEFLQFLANLLATNKIKISKST